MWTLSCSMHVGSSSLARDWTRAPCIGSVSLNHCATRDVPETCFYVGGTYHYLARRESGWGLDPVSFPPGFLQATLHSTDREVLSAWAMTSFLFGHLYTQPVRWLIHLKLLQSTRPKNQLLSVNHLWWVTSCGLLPWHGADMSLIPCYLISKETSVYVCVTCRAFPLFNQVNKETSVSQLRFLLFSSSKFAYFYNTAPMLSYLGGDEPPNRLTHGYCPRFHSGFYGNRHQMAQNKVRARRHLQIPRHLQTLFVQHLFPWKQMQKRSTSTLQ